MRPTLWGEKAHRLHRSGAAAYFDDRAAILQGVIGQMERWPRGAKTAPFMVNPFLTATAYPSVQ